LASITACTRGTRILCCIEKKRKKHHGKGKKMIEHQETETHRGRGGATGDEQEEGRRRTLNLDGRSVCRVKSNWITQQQQQQQEEEPDDGENNKSLPCPKYQEQGLRDREEEEASKAGFGAGLRHGGDWGWIGGGVKGRKRWSALGCNTPQPSDGGGGEAKPRQGKTNPLCAVPLSQAPLQQREV